MQIAIGTAGNIQIWASVKHITEKGEILFDVINGGWAGKFYKNTVYVNGNEEVGPSEILWAGRERGDYNTVIPRLEELIKSPDYEVMSMEEILAHEIKERYFDDDFDDDIAF